MKELKKFPIASEEIEPFAAMLIGRMFARCEEAKKNGDQHHVYDACNSLWFALDGLEKIAVAIRSGVYTEHGIHFSIAMNNNIRFIREYIEEAVGFDPSKAEGWAWR